MFSSLRQALTLHTPSAQSRNDSYTEFKYEFSEKDQSGLEIGEGGEDDYIFSPSNYKAHQRRAGSFESMGSYSVDLGSSRGEKQGGRTGKGTGFPEPLSPDRNTTLPHPDADTSLNATIEAPDIDLERAHSRRNFLRNRNSHNRKGMGRSEVSLPGPEKLGQSFASLEAKENKKKARENGSLKEERVVKDRDSGVEVGTDGGRSVTSGSRSSMENDGGFDDGEVREKKRGFLERLRR